MQGSRRALAVRARCVLAVPHGREPERRSAHARSASAAACTSQCACSSSSPCARLCLAPRLAAQSLSAPDLDILRQKSRQWGVHTLSRQARARPGVHAAGALACSRSGCAWSATHAEGPGSVLFATARILRASALQARPCLSIGSKAWAGQNPVSPSSAPSRVQQHTCSGTPAADMTPVSFGRAHRAPLPALHAGLLPL